MERAHVRFVSRCRGGSSIRTHRCATFRKRRTTTRLNRPSAMAVRKSHAGALHARARKLARARGARACHSRAAAAA
eukprot:186929-Lingulodinium_polyedra.AAC.1